MTDSTRTIDDHDRPRPDDRGADADVDRSDAPSRPTPPRRPSVTPRRRPTPRRRARGRLGAGRAGQHRAAASPRVGALRWAAALAVVAVVLGASAAVAALHHRRVARRSTSSATSRPTAIAYGEVRLDLPGDQRQAVGAVPVASSRASPTRPRSTRKLDEVLDQLVNEGDERQADLHDGHQAVVRRRARRSRSGPLPAGRVDDRPGDAALGDVPGTAPCCPSRTRPPPRPGSTRRSPRPAPTTTTETYNGVTLTVFDAADTATEARLRDHRRQGRRRSATSTSVKAADRHRRERAASPPSPVPRRPSPRSTGDHVGFVYVALQPLLDWSTGLNKARRLGPARRPPISDGS